MLEEKSPVLRIMIILLTIIGAVATVFSCVIAYMAFVNPQRTEIVLKQLSSPSTFTPVVITVIAPTATPYPTYTPYAGSPSIPEATQMPTEKEQNPAPGEIVQAGQAISKAGISVTMGEDIGIDRDLFGFSFTIKNSRADNYVIRYKSSYFRVTDDLDNQYTYHIQWGGCGDTEEALDLVKQSLISSKQVLTIEPTSCGWSGVTAETIPFFKGSIDPDAKFLIVTVDKLAGMENLKWRHDLD